jgi:hypothetical protein
MKQLDFGEWIVSSPYGEVARNLLTRHNVVRKESSAWRLFVGHVFKLFIYKTQTAIFSFMQCKVLIIDVS